MVGRGKAVWLGWQRAGGCMTTLEALRVGDGWVVYDDMPSNGAWHATIALRTTTTPAGQWCAADV